jgi:microcystin-dependent protein
MANPFIGEIRMFAGNFAPEGWAFCQGQTLAIAASSALFDLIGTTYGGNGEQTFNLPDLRGRFPIHQGFSQESFVIGQLSGAETVTLTTNQLPAHSHPAACSPGTGDSEGPAGNFWSTDPAGNTAAYNESGAAMMSAGATAPTGGGQPHDNMSPFLVINFIISLVGIFPSQS